MDKLIMLVILAVVIFMLTYDPKTGNLEKYLKPFNKMNDNQGQGCSDNDFRSKNPGQCKDPAYEDIQFATTDFMKPTATNSRAGAIIRQ